MNILETPSHRRAIQAAMAVAGMLVITLGSVLGCDTASRGPRLPDAAPASHVAAPAAQPPPESADYGATLELIKAKREALAAQMRRAGSGPARDRLRAEARALLASTIADIVPYWYGTPWDFNGTTEQPGSGTIACGYFVTTVLRDAGFRIARARLAQQASETIILSLTGGKHVKRFSNAAIGAFVDTIRAWGPGVYVVGLDVHVGLILHTGDDVYFVHSSYVAPRTVVSEKAIDSRVLASSRYRVIGKLSEDDGLLEKWLFGRTM